MEPGVRVLLIEGDSNAARRIQRALTKADNGAFAVESVDRLLPGLDRLADGGIDVCVLDLSLPDSHGLRAVLAARAQAPDVPVLVLAPSGDDEAARRAVKEGARECLSRDELDPELLRAAVRGAASARLRPRPRSRESTARKLPTLGQAVDGLTSLLNERGLLALGERHVEIAILTRRPFAVLYIDVDGLAAANETHSTDAGDSILVDVAKLLTATFRGSDVVARVGGDEFCVLLSVVSAAEPSEAKVLARLEQAIERLNAKRDRLPISLTVGTARFDPELPAPFEAVLVRAKHEMRERKSRAAYT
jgi:diguanylate cyclase (GGDEF)-like protein